MYTCHECKTKFKNEPYISCTNGKKYCSLECFPPCGMDKPYSYQYFNLIDNIREIVSKIDNITTLEERIELEEETSNLSFSYSIEIFGDDEGLFYKKQIAYLIEKLEVLWDKIHTVFVNRKINLKPGIIISLYELEQLAGNELAGNVMNEFLPSIAYSLFENLEHCIPSLSLEYYNSCRIKISFPTLIEAKDIASSFKKLLVKHTSRLTEKQKQQLKDYDYYLNVVRFTLCPICKEWEDSRDFSFNDNLKLSQC